MVPAHDTEAFRDSNRGPVLLSVSVTTTAFAIFMCGTRLLVRSKLSQTLRWDDFALLGSAVLALIGAAFTIVEASSTQNSVRAAQYHFLSQPWLMFSSTLAKTSVCLFFLRVFGRRLGQWNLALAGLVMAMVVVNLAVTLVLSLQCQPMRIIWDTSVEGKCFGTAVGLNAAFASGGFEILSYFSLAISSHVLVRDVDLVPGIRWPFYTLSVSSFIAGTLCIVRAHQTSIAGVRGRYTTASSTVTLLGVLIQNTGIFGANILPLGSLFSQRAEQLRLGSSSDNEMSDQRSTNQSSFITVKRSSTLIIEGPKDKRGPPVKRKPVANAREAGRGQKFTTVTVAGMHGVGEPTDDVSMKMGIVKTTTIEVFEEGVADLGTRPARAFAKAHLKAKTATSEDWKHILRGPIAP